MEPAVQPFISRPLNPGDSDGRRRSDEIRHLLDQAAALDDLMAQDPRTREDVNARRAVLAANVLHLLQGWRARGGEVRLDPPTEVIVRQPRPPTLVDTEEVRGHLKRILAGLAPSTDQITDLDRVHATIRESARWANLPRELRRSVVALCTTRLRHLQDDCRLTSPRLEEAFAMLTAYSKREQPGFVVGLSRAHKPVRGLWTDDAAAWFDRLSTWGEPDAVTEETEAPEPRATEATAETP